MLSILDGHEKGKAIERLGGSDLFAVKRTCVQLDLPYLKSCNVIEVFKREVLTKVAKIPPRDCFLVVSMKYKLGLSCKKVLCNSKRWSRDIDKVDFPHTCAK